MKLTPHITVITVVYNSVNTIEQTINNVLNLSYPNLDFIIVDGASNDGTIEVINNYKFKLTNFISEPDKGIYDAMNKGWSLAKNDSYIIFLGSGDMILSLPNVKYYEHADVIYGDVKLGNKMTFRSEISFRSYFGNTIHHQAMLVKKSIHLEPPFSLDFSTYSDFDFNQRLLKTKTKFVKDTDFLSFALEGGVSEQLNYAESFKVVRKNHGTLVSYIAQLYYLLQKLNGYRRHYNRDRNL